MIDVLVTQQSKWIATRVLIALFGQSHVDFSADPWIGIKSSKKKAQPQIEMRSGKKASRIQREFSQSQSESSQTQLVEESFSESEEEEVPAGTVHYYRNPDGSSSSVQDFSGFQYQNFQMNNNQFSTEPFQEEHIFPGFLGPQDSSSFL